MDIRRDTILGVAHQFTANTNPLLPHTPYSSSSSNKPIVHTAANVSLMIGGGSQ